MKHIDTKANIEKDNLNNSLDIAKIMASEGQRKNHCRTP